MIYDPARAVKAVEKFKSLIENRFSQSTVRIISNNSTLKGDIIGSNACGEFSGWMEGVFQQDYNDYDLIIFANDTFCTKRTFGDKEETKFIKSLASARSISSLYLVGDLHWHINYQLMLKKKKFLLKWVRTHIFGVSTDALKKIGGISLLENQLASMIKIDCFGDFIISEDIPEVMRQRIEDWLRPADPSLGWHGSQHASRSHLALKAKCVLQELDVTKRCIEAGVFIYSTARIRKRDYLLSLLYNFQSRFL